MYYHYDGLGNVMQLTDSSAAVVKTYTYEAFGSLVAQSGSVANPYQFQTKHINPATGFSHFGFRSYSPAVGRFVTADPLGFVNGPNLYAYVGNNPLNWIDPWGLCKKDTRGEWYFDIGYSGFGPSPSHPGINIGFQIGSEGLNFYWGVGLGYGAGFTATFHPAQSLPSPGTKVSVVGRFGIEGFGIKAIGSVTQGGPAGRIGFGVGIGVGVSSTATHTIRIFSWDWN